MLEYRAEMLNSHNNYRSRHSVGSLTENATISLIAQNYSVFLANNDIFKHNEEIDLGENLGFMWSTEEPNLDNCTGYIK